MWRRATLSSQDGRPERILAAVVVDLEPAVIEHAHEQRPLVVEVGHRLAGEHLRRNVTTLGIEPSLKLVPHRTRLVVSSSSGEHRLVTAHPMIEFAALRINVV